MATKKAAVAAATENSAAEESSAQEATSAAGGQHLLPNESIELLTAILAEHARDATAKRKASLDDELLRTRRDEIRREIVGAAAKVEADAPKWLPGLLFLYDQGFDEYEIARKIHGTSVPGQQRYSLETKTLTRDLYVVVTDIRKSSGDRLAHEEATDGLRRMLGVGVSISPNAPQDVLAVALSQIAAATGEKSAAVLRHAGLFPARWATRLEPLAQKLQRSIHEGIGNGVRRGEASDEMNAALLKLEITLSRAVAWLAEFASRSVADRLEQSIPKKHGRRASDVEPNGGGGGGGAPGGGGTA